MIGLQKMVARGASGVSVVCKAQALNSFPLLQNSVTANTSGLIIKYFRQGDLTMPEGGVSVATAGLTSITGAGLSMGFSGGFVWPIDSGHHRIDIPDAAWAKAVGVNNVLISVTSTGHFWTGALVQLIDGTSSGGIVGQTPGVY